MTAAGSAVTLIDVGKGPAILAEGHTMKAHTVETVRYSDTARTVALSTRADGRKVSTIELPREVSFSMDRRRWETAVFEPDCRGCAEEGRCTPCDDRTSVSYTRADAVLDHEIAVDLYLVEHREERVWHLVLAAALCIVALVALASFI